MRKTKQAIWDVIDASGIDVLYPVGSNSWSIGKWEEYLKQQYPSVYKRLFESRLRNNIAKVTKCVK